jgi:hypothetical protein
VEEPQKLDYETPVKKPRRIFSRDRIIAGGMLAIHGCLAAVAGYVLVGEFGQPNSFGLPAIGFIFILLLLILLCGWQAGVMISRVTK